MGVRLCDSSHRTHLDAITLTEQRDSVKSGPLIDLRLCYEYLKKYNLYVHLCAQGYNFKRESFVQFKRRRMLSFPHCFVLIWCCIYFYVQTHI